MPADPVTVLADHVRSLAGAPPGRAASDRELLHGFAARRDAAAFAALVPRHGPLGLRVCRRVLGNGHDAEDVFQATFLVLARKAASARWHDSVANWLYGVAYRLARKLREAAARRAARESRAAVYAGDDPLAAVTGRELLCAL